MRDRQLNSAVRPLAFLLVSGTDHVSPVTGATPTVTISKNCGTFAAPAGAVSEVGNGWYALAANAADRNTLGPFLLHATAAGADPTDVEGTIVAYDPFDGAKLGLTGLDFFRVALDGTEPANSPGAILFNLPTEADQQALVAGQIAATPVVLPASPPAAYATAAGVAAVKVDTAKVAGLVETSGSVDRFKAAALAAAPAGTVDPAAIVSAINAAGVKLRGDGLDAIVVEAGINARQALAPILAATAGIVAGAGSGLITIKGGRSDVVRITATTDQSGNRPSVLLSIPD